MTMPPRRTVADALADFGWSDVIDIGGIEGSRELEAICIAWVKIAGARGRGTTASSCSSVSHPARARPPLSPVRHRMGVLTGHGALTRVWLRKSLGSSAG
jgi:hypothetical protein